MIGALLLTLVLIFAFQAENLTTRWLAVLLLAVPIVIQVYFNSSAGLSADAQVARAAQRRRRPAR